MAWLLATLLTLTTLSSVKSIPLEDFYPFGADSGDSRLVSNDDDSSQVLPLSRFPFYGEDHFSIVVSDACVQAFLK
jgi:hypothetical protein